MIPSPVRILSASCAILLATLALCLLPACERGVGSEADAADGPRKIRLQLNWFPEPEFGGFYAAESTGAFARRDLEVELLPGSADVPGPQLLAAGQVDAAIVSASQLVTLRASGGRIVAVHASFQKAPRAIVVRRDSPYETLADLWAAEGRFMAGDGEPYLRWLERELGPSGLVRVPYAGSLAPFLAGEVLAMQAFATAEPVQLESDGVATRVFLVADTGLDPYDVVLAVREEMLDSEPEVVARLVEAVAEGWEAYLGDPATVNRIIGGLNPDFTPRTLELAASRLPRFVRSEDTDVHGLGWMSEDRWKTLVDQMVEIEEISPAERDGLGRLFVNPARADPAAGSEPANVG